MGNIVSLDSDGQGPPDTSVGYDALHRLREFRAPGQAHSYRYDATGNRTLATVNGSDQTYVYPPTSHRLQQVGDASYRTYDATGNLIEDRTNPALEDWDRYTYDARNRMVGFVVNTPSGDPIRAVAQSWEYQYNGAGQRVRKSEVATIGGGTQAPERYFLYDHARMLLGEYDLQGVVKAEYLWVEGVPMAVRVPASAGVVDLYGITADHLGTPRAVFNGSGVPVWRWPLVDGESFGHSAPQEDPDGNEKPFVFNLRFPGQYYDAESGLHYNYFRDYEPGTGRYVQSDPIGLAGGSNTFGYADASSLEMIDPFGLLARTGCYDLYIESVEEFKYKTIHRSGECPSKVLVGIFFNPKKHLLNTPLTQDCEDGECVNKRHVHKVDWVEKDFEITVDFCWTHGGVFYINEGKGPCPSKKRRCIATFKLSGQGTVSGWVGDCESCEKAMQQVLISNWQWWIRVGALVVLMCLFTVVGRADSGQLRFYINKPIVYPYGPIVACSGEYGEILRRFAKDVRLKAEETLQLTILSWDRPCRFSSDYEFTGAYGGLFLISFRAVVYGEPIEQGKYVLLLESNAMNKEVCELIERETVGRCLLLARTGPPRIDDP